MTGLLGQPLEVEKLRATVPFAEGVDIVHVTHDRPYRGRELRAAQASQKIGSLYALVNVLHPGVDEPVELELMTALGNLHRPNLPGPVVDILEQLPMDGAQVHKVKAAGRDALSSPLRDQQPLHAVELTCIGETQLIP